MLDADFDFADRIYEAAVLPEFWPDLLCDMAQRTTGGSAIVFASSADDVRFVASSEQYGKDATEFFAQHPDNERTRRLLAARHPGFLTDFDVFSFDERESLPIFRDFFLPRGYGDGAATAIPMPTGEMVIVHLEGPYKREPFDRGKVAWLDSIRPHLARSSFISARLAFERARTAVDTLSGIGLAACAVTQAGTVLVANPAFVAEAGFWTTRGGNRIALLDRRADRLLGDALSIVAAGKGVRSLPLAPEGEMPAVMHVVPVRRAAHDLFGLASAILVLTKASDAPTRATPLLQALFDLSPVEATIAARIAAGQTAEQIARADDKSVDTVRNQLKNVLDKTGCRRQVDLARLLAQLVFG